MLSLISHSPNIALLLGLFLFLIFSPLVFRYSLGHRVQLKWWQLIVWSVGVCLVITHIWGR